jgi:GGDEF domain-containing protein
MTPREFAINTAMQIPSRFAESVMLTGRIGLDLAADAAERNRRRRPSGMSPSGAIRGTTGRRTQQADVDRIRRASANLRAREELIQEITPDPTGFVGSMAAHLGRETVPFIAAAATTPIFGIAPAASRFTTLGRTIQRSKRGAALFGTLDVTSGRAFETAREDGGLEALFGVGKSAASGALFEAGLIGPIAEIFGANGARALNTARIRNNARAEHFNLRRRNQAGQRLIDEAAEAGRLGPERQLVAGEAAVGPQVPPVEIVLGGEVERMSAREGLRRAAGRGSRTGGEETRRAAEAEVLAGREGRAAARSAEQTEVVRVREALQAEIEARRAVRDITTRGGKIDTGRQISPASERTPPGVIEMTGDSEVLALSERARRLSEPTRRSRGFVGPQREPQSVTEALTRQLQEAAEEPLAGGATGAAERFEAKLLADDARLRRRISDMEDQDLIDSFERLFRDPQTGLGNAAAWAEAKPRVEANPNLELVWFDVENLKGVNTLLGDPAGDAALVEAGRVVEKGALARGVEHRDVIRPRSTGDEFVVVARTGEGRAMGEAIQREYGDRLIIEGGGERTSLRFGVGQTEEIAQAGADAAKEAEVLAGRTRFREVEKAVPRAQETPAPRVANPSSRQKIALRKAALRQTEQGVIKSAPEPRGRRGNQVPADAEAGPNGPVDNVVDQATGKTIPSNRTRTARLKQVLFEGDEGGFIEGTRDILETRTPEGLPEASQRIQKAMSLGESTPRKLPSFIDLYERIFRRSAGIEAGGKKLRVRGPNDRVTQNDVDAAAALATGSARRAEAMLMYGPGKFDGLGNWEWSGTPGYMEVLSPLEGKLNAYRRYVLAKRTLEVGGEGRGIVTGISMEDAGFEVNGQVVVEEIKAAQRQTTSYLRDVARYYQEATGMPQERLELMFALGEDYIPLTRVFEGTDPFGGGAGTVGRPGRGFGRLKGGTRRHVDPIESVVDYTQRMIRAADINRIGRTFVDAAVENPEAAAGIIERVARLSDRAITREAEALVESLALRGRNVSIEEAADIVESLGDKSLTLADDVIRVWRNGELQAWRVNPSIARGIRAMQPAQMNWMIGLLSMPSRAARAGITLNPGFQAFNIIRDTFDASIQSEFGFRLGVDSFLGFYESVKGQWLNMPSDVYMEAAASGFGFSAIRGTGRQTTQQLVKRILPDVTTRSGRVFKIATMPFRHPYQMLSQSAVPFEEAARMGEFMRAKTKGANSVEALMASKNVTVDFQQIGSTMQSYAYMTKFLNAGLQSLDVAVRTGIRPVAKARQALQAGESKADAARILRNEAVKVYGTAIGAISIPTMMLWAANRGDQEIEDLRKSDAGRIYWFVRDPFHLDVDGNEEIVRMPKPFLYGQIFGTGMESVLDAMFEDDPVAMGRWAQGVAEQGAVNMFPDAFQIGVEQWANKSYFFNSPIVPEELERVEPGMQATERTTRIARKIGEMFPQSVSPLRIEKVFNDVLGSLPTQILRYIDRSIDRFDGDNVTDPAPMRSDITFFGRFFARNPSLSVEPVRTFWDNALQAEEALASLALADERLDLSKADQLIEDRMSDFVVAELYEGSRRQITDIRNAIEGVRDMPDNLFAEGTDPADTKREWINEYMREYVETARLTNELAKLLIQELDPAFAEQGAN